MDTDKLLEQYFQKEQRKEDSLQLQERIAKQTYKKNVFSWRKLTFPAVAATLLLVLFGIAFWTSTQRPNNNVQLAQREIIYEDEDLMIYLK